MYTQQPFTPLNRLCTPKAFSLQKTSLVLFTCVLMLNSADKAEAASKANR